MTPRHRQDDRHAAGKALFRRADSRTTALLQKTNQPQPLDRFHTQPVTSELGHVPGARPGCIYFHPFGLRVIEQFLLMLASARAASRIPSRFVHSLRIRDHALVMPSFGRYNSTGAQYALRFPSFSMWLGRTNMPSS